MTRGDTMNLEQFMGDKPLFLYYTGAGRRAVWLHYDSYSNEFFALKRD